MSRSPSFILSIPEGKENPSQDLSPYDESIVHDSFHQLIQEQSQQAEAEALELQEWSSRDKDGVRQPQSESYRAPQDYSSATLRILANMPSRTIGRSRGAIISQYYNQTVRLRRKNSRPLLRDMSRSARPSVRQYDLDLDLTPREEEEKRSLLVKELQGLTVAQRDHMLQVMPLSLTEKRCLRQDSCIQRGRQKHHCHSQTQLYCCSRLKYHCIITFRSLWYGLLSSLYALKPWRYSLKQISGQFGSSVLSYFLFLKTLISFNVLLLLLLLPFIVAVQLAFPPTSEFPFSQSFTGLELFTGRGQFTHTVMYYGYYSNFTLNQPCSSQQNNDHCPLRTTHLPYNMPLAYLFTVGVSFFTTCITLVYSMSHSFGKSYQVGSTPAVHAITVFCSWDYRVTQNWAAHLQHDNIRTQLKELLAEWQLKQHPRSMCGKLRQMIVLLLVWLLCLGTALGCAIAVYSFSEFMHENHETKTQMISEKLQEARLLALPLIVCIINLVVPYLYNVFASWEQHDSPVLEVYVAICRNLILKMVILGLLCYHWMGRKIRTLGDQCWETFVGQELYRFMIMDFIFTLLDTLFGELVWRLIVERLKGDRKPEFDVARNVLELIYGQTLTWLGVLFSPLLPAIQLLKLLFLFYIKKISLMANCQAPRKPWRALHMTTIFITLLCFPSFLGAAIFLSYAIWQVRPSRTCGPFRTLDTIYEASKVWIRRLEEASPTITWFTWIHQYLVENTFFIFLISAVLLAVIYFNIQMVKGQRKVICLLKEQINNEGEDKIFLINKLHSIYESRATSN
ncbi:transmembrane channel-like protein 6 [Gracilinanus agilis]|uniref:transmembrane channel-like protein 6 n=1 Tax=Gracilinanus agilis TaxID=191870 RepID=UPI001CFDA635|nr:transmembrane channel-like protein 6 [Gracilinanus agilis]